MTEISAERPWVTTLPFLHGGLGSLQEGLCKQAGDLLNGRSLEMAGMETFYEKITSC